MNSYSIEQVELIRRLRASGITANQVIEAFKEFDRLEWGLNSRLCENEASTSSGIFPIALNDTGTNAVSVSYSTNNSSSLGCSTLNSETTGAAGGAISPSPDFENDENENQVIWKIKNYIRENQISQYDIARTCGISQPYISRFLNGNLKSYGRIKVIILDWFTKMMNGSHIPALPPDEKFEPVLVQMFFCTKVAEYTYQISPLSPELQFKCTYTTWHTILVSFSVSKKTIDEENWKQKEKQARFHLQPIHSVILYKYFVKNAYPNQQARQELVKKLNEVYAAKCKKSVAELTSFEIMTERFLISWFSNNRQRIRTKGLKYGGLLKKKRGRPRVHNLTAVSSTDQAQLPVDQAVSSTDQAQIDQDDSATLMVIKQEESELADVSLID